MREYRKKNHAKELARTQKWQEDNPTHNRERYQKYRDKEVARVNKYRDENRGDVNARNRQRLRNNREKIRPLEARRRARKANAPQGAPTEAAAYEQILRSAPCELCGSKVPIHVDHIEPLSKGGEHGWENFAGLCQSCNSHKNSKSLLVYLLTPATQRSTNDPTR